MNHINKKFDDLEVIKDISLSVKEGGDSFDHRTFRLRKIDAAQVCDDAGEEINGGEISYLGESCLDWKLRRGMSSKEKRT